MIYPIQLISMALFANDGEDTINAWDASFKKPYWCLECRGPLKLKRGLFKLPHFYHLSKSPSCRLYSKSTRHLLIQQSIQKKLPLNKVQMERSFPTIQRIADLVWEEKKIVFEIQCSPISEREAKERTLEYNSLGYEVVWILDENLFNKRHLSKGERFIRARSSYFIERGNSFAIYDQLEIVRNLKRLKKGEKTQVDISAFKSVPQNTKAPLPKLLKERLEFCKIFFENDWISKLEKEAQTLSNWKEAEKQLLSAHPQFLIKNIGKFYRKLLNALLKGC